MMTIIKPSTIYYMCLSFSDGRSLGYAFVQYTSYFDALKAVDEINGTVIKGHFNKKVHKHDVNYCEVD